MRNKKPREHSLFLKAFRAYLQYVNSGLYFRKEHVLGLENVPANGTPVIVVANHQNCLNDPLCVCLQLTDRRMNFLARANVFNNPIFNKALRSMGLLPAYRMSHEGLAAVRQNQVTFEDAGTRLCFYAAVEEKSFAALEKTHPSLGFFASLKKAPFKLYESI